MDLKHILFTPTFVNSSIHNKCFFSKMVYDDVINNTKYRYDDCEMAEIYDYFYYGWERIVIMYNHPRNI